MEIREGLLDQPPRRKEEEEERRTFLDVMLDALSGLRAKLIVPYVLLTMVIAMVGVFIVTSLVTSSIRERFVNQLFEASRVVADGVVRHEKDHLEELRLMAFMEGVPEAISDRDADRLQEILWPIALNNGIEAIAVIDPLGIEIMTLALEPATNQYLVSSGADFSGFDMVVKGLAGMVDEIGDKYADLMVTSFGPYLFTNAPVRDDTGHMVGLLLVGTRLESLLAELKSQALADITILNREGGFISTTLVEPDEGFQLLELNPQDMRSATSTTRELELYDRDYQAVDSPLIVRQMEMGILSVVLPSNYIVTTMATSRNTFSLLFSLGTVATIIVGYILAQSIAKPILRLRSISTSVAAGDLDQSSGFERADEIGELASAFDTMTFRLRERTAEAARLYAETVERNEELAEINERLQSAQAQLVQSEKLASVGQLTAGIVHDVKNPLAVIKGLAEELHEEVGIDPSTRAQLTTIRDSASRASTIVTDLLKFARQSTPEMQRRDMRETIQSSLRLTEYLTRKGKIEVTVELPDQPVMMAYDAQQIEQVLINLITNAVQAMQHGGSLRVNLTKSGSKVAIAVQDTGTGIPKQNLNRIFDPFFTTKPEGEGTGLGLSVSYGIVSRHGGTIEVESELGWGTTFNVFLPEDPSSQIE
ncbi:MAG: HAMP domain-containing protein [Anaerolineaceae bacterium]|nr:MAG: HAMP domain-containing protein [Anaerolineaceae bacterium]